MMKNTDCSSRGHKFKSYHLYNISQPSVNSSSKGTDSMLTSDLQQYQALMWQTEIHVGNPLQT